MMTRRPFRSPGFQLVFVDPQDQNVEFPWPAMVVQPEDYAAFRDVMGADIPKMSATESLVCYFEDASYSVVDQSDLTPFHLYTEPYTYLARKHGARFTSDRAVAAAARCFRREGPPNSFKWLKPQLRGGGNSNNSGCNSANTICLGGNDDTEENEIDFTTHTSNSGITIPRSMHHIKPRKSSITSIASTSSSENYSLSSTSMLPSTNNTGLSTSPPSLMPSMWSKRLRSEFDTKVPAGERLRVEQQRNDQRRASDYSLLAPMLPIERKQRYIKFIHGDWR